MWFVVKLKISNSLLSVEKNIKLYGTARRGAENVLNSYLLILDLKKKRLFDLYDPYKFFEKIPWVNLLILFLITTIYFIVI